MILSSKILIVDDEPAILEYLELEMHRLGYETVRAENGREALEKVAAAMPDLILLDVRMPVMDGLAVCRTLKESDATQLIPVIMMTALGSLEARIRGIEAGADDYLTKPVDRRELVTRIKTALCLKHAVDRKLRELRRAKEQLGKFVPETIRRLVSQDPEAPGLAKQERDVTVLFVDISGYTALCERLPHTTVSALVERYFSAFLDRIGEADGDVTEVAGDGFMAVFRDDDLSLHPRQAAEAALAILAETDALNQRGPSQPLAVHLGINSGVALVGSFRFDGARGARRVFSAQGPVTNLAARLTGAAAPGEILAGPETARRLNGRYRLERAGVRNLKNIPGSIEVHRILPGEGTGG